MSNTSLLGAFGGQAGDALMFRNKLINGNFDIWQRGTSSTNTQGVVSADRWFIAAGNTNTSRQSFATGQTAVSDNPQYFMRVTRTVASGTPNEVIGQRIENPEQFSGQTVTVSFWAKVSSGTKSFNIDFIASMNSAIVLDTPGVTITATTSWQKFTCTEALGNFASGATRTVNDFLTFRILELSGLSTFDLDIVNAQLEIGPVATPFERRPIGVELGMAMRYYEKSYNIDVAPGTNTPAGQESFAGLYYSSASAMYAGGTIRYKVVKRANPTTISRISYDGTSGQWHYGVAGLSEGKANATVFSSGTSGFSLYLSSVPAGQNSMYGHWAADAEL